jgi:hypothetical protein
MPLRVKLLAEPFTDYSKGTEPILATSAEYHKLRRALERYTSGLIQGRSYLIAGHRGSGKTILVHKAIEDLVRSSLNRESRPLFVRLHGPDLLPPIIESDQEPEKPAGKETNPTTPPKRETATSAADPAKPPAATALVTDPATVPVTNGAAASDKETNKQLDIVLKQMMKSLFRDVTNEYRRCYREAILRLPNGLKRTNLLEVAAQFDLDLTDYVTPSRLRNYWHRIGAFSNGILLTSDRTKYKTYGVSDAKPEVLSATDIGLQEVLVLSSLSQAFQLIAGTVEEKQKQIDAAKDERASSLSTAYALKNLFGPIAGLLTGGFVGIQIGTTNPIAAVLLGLLTGAVVSFGFTYTSTRSKSKEMSLESIFIKDRTVATLSSVLPLLVVRLRDIGLAPVFVIDELDKVRDLQDRMQNLIRHLKFLVTENAFSCFLTDRRYLDYLNSQANQNAYAPEYTYFSDRLVVLYRPVELRDFVKNALEIVAAPRQVSQNLTPDQASTQEKQDQEEVEKISYVLLHRARMHPIDLRRQIDSLTGSASFSMADAFSSPRFRFEILIQVTIEWLLDGEDVQARLSGNPYYRQVVYDAFYYVSRLWDDAGADGPQVPGFREFGTDSVKKPGLEFNEKDFLNYLESRNKLEDLPGRSRDAAPVSDKKVQSTEHPHIGGLDSKFLLGKVGELLGFLCKPEILISEINRSQRQTKPPELILNEIPKDASLRLLIQHEDGPKYRWLYDASGRSLQPKEVSEIVNDNEVQDAIVSIRDLIAELIELGLPGDIYTLAEAKVIPRPTEWKDVVQPALDRLDVLSVEGNAYGNMDADRDAVVEFQNTLTEFEPNLKAALLSAAVFAPEVTVSVPTPGARLSAALTQVCARLQLSATAEEDLRRLSVLLGSVPTGLLDPTVGDELGKVLKFVGDLIIGNPATDNEATNTIKAAWDVAKGRFSKSFHEGTVRFDTQYEDVFTSIKHIGPGYELAADLSTITSRVWTKLLLRALSEDKVPAWLRVAAAIELRMLGLAEKLATTLVDDQRLLLQWVEDARRNASTQVRRGVLVLAAELKSITENWQPSTRHAALVLTVTDFGQLANELKKNGVSGPYDYPIDGVAIELSGDSKQLDKLVTMKPLSAISEMSSTRAGATLRELDPFLSSLELCYLVSETPSQTMGPTALPLITAPKGLDDLIDRFSDPDRSASL